MTNYQLESFINFCDDMMIAEEGLIRTLFKSCMRKICRTGKSLKKDNSDKKVKLTPKKAHGEPRLLYTNDAVKKLYDYNGYEFGGVDEYTNTRYELMNNDQLTKCKPAISEYLSVIDKFKAIVSKANNAAGGNYFTFMNEAKSAYEVVYDESTGKVSITGYPIGYEYNDNAYRDKSISAKVEKAWDEMELDIGKLCTGNSQCVLCKPNCDGFPEYCYNYHRYYWFNMDLTV